MIALIDNRIINLSLMIEINPNADPNVDPDRATAVELIFIGGTKARFWFQVEPNYPIPPEITEKKNAAVKKFIALITEKWSPTDQFGEDLFKLATT